MDATAKTLLRLLKIERALHPEAAAVADHYRLAILQAAATAPQVEGANVEDDAEPAHPATTHLQHAPA